MERSKHILTTIVAILGFVVFILFIRLFFPTNTSNSTLTTESTITETVSETTSPSPITVTIPLEDIIDNPSTVETTSAAETETEKETKKETRPKETAKETESSSVESQDQVDNEQLPTESETEPIVDESTSSESTETDSESETETERNMTYLGKYYITGYGTGSCCNGSGNANKTASGEPLTPWWSVAMKGIPFGTRIYIDGLGEFEVHDRGVGSGKVDVCVNVCEHIASSKGKSESYAITGKYDVYIIE